jgi:hypothetical protein
VLGRFLQSNHAQLNQLSLLVFLGCDDQVALEREIKPKGR